MRAGRASLRLAAAVAAFALAGCAALLPKGRAEVTSQWSSFEQARDTIEQIVPGRTTTAELHELGIDPYAADVNVLILSYSDVLLKFPLASNIDHLDVGLKACLEAGKACTGYSIVARDTKRDRIGNFWVDALGFKRVTNITGWSFNALLLLVDGRVVYTLYGGQPQLHEQEVTRQPLGPLQNWGDAVDNLVK